MTGHEYEQVVARYLQRHGYYGVQVTKGSGDFGVDVIARKGLTKYAVQCKYYSHAVGLDAIQEVVAGKTYYGCDAAMVVTNSTFTKAARELATRNGVKLIERVNGFGFVIPSKWLLAIAGLYILLIAAPALVAAYRVISENPSPKSVAQFVVLIPMVAIPFWILPAIRLVFRLITGGVRLLIECLKTRKKNVKPEPVNPAPEAVTVQKPLPVINPTYVLPLLDQPNVPVDPVSGDYLIYLAKRAVIACADNKHVSATMIQRKCEVSFSTAQRAIKTLEDIGIIEKDEQNQYVYAWSEKAKHAGEVTDHVRGDQL